jgi:integrase
MGLYRRTWRRKDGKIITSKPWWISVMIDGRQHCESTGTSNKRLAQRILNLRTAEIIEGRFRLPKSRPPRLGQFSQGFLDSIRHENTKKRYASSVANLRAHFGDARLSSVTPEGIDKFKQARLSDNVRAATVNRDLAVLRRMLRIAEKRRLIAGSPFREVEMLEERKERRQPHILTFEEEEKLLAVAPAPLRVLTILILDTGLRSGREALSLQWGDIDFANDSVQIKESKTLAGIRMVPMSGRCKAELLAWGKRLGPEFSEYVFANPQRPNAHLTNFRRAWPKALKAAGLEYFWVYDLRHTFASRLTQAGVSPVFVAQIMGHSSTSVLQTYAKAIDEYRRSAISKLEALREAQSARSAGRSERDNALPIQ